MTTTNEPVLEWSNCCFMCANGAAPSPYMPDQIACDSHPELHSQFYTCEGYIFEEITARLLEEGEQDE